MNADKTFLGFVVGIYSMGQFLGSIVFGIW